MEEIYEEIYLDCSDPIVRDPAAVVAILGRYYIRPRWAVNTDGRLYVSNDSWPVAVPLTLLPPKPPDRAGDWPPEELIDEHGHQGFLDLLAELAPHLATPLTIQAVATPLRRYEGDVEWGGLEAVEYHAEPGGTAAEFNGFRHSVEDGRSDADGFLYEREGYERA